MTFVMSAKITESDHADECCEIHGCKWGNHACPVATHMLRQVSSCEECDEWADDLSDGKHWW